MTTTCLRCHKEQIRADETICRACADEVDKAAKKANAEARAPKIWHYGIPTKR